MSLQEDRAIREFLFRCSIPIVVEGRDSARSILGNGALFEINSRAYLITAAHVLDGVDFNCVGVPVRAGAAGEAWTFMGSVVHKPHDSEMYDIALVELRNTELIAELRSGGWRFLGVDQVGVVKGKEYFLAGYPAALKRATDNDVTAKLFVLRTVRRDDVFLSKDINRTRVIPGVDVFFAYGKEGISNSGERVQMPPLSGISGASIWTFNRVAESGIWSVEKQSKVVAIETAYLRDEYIRAKSWSVIATALRQIDPQGAEQVFDAAARS